MARVPFTTAETTARRFVRQLFMRKIKDNDDDHEARILQVEGPLRMFDHFNHSSIASELQLNDHTLHPQTFDYTKWQTRAGGGESVNANADLSNLAFNAFPVTRQGFSLQDNPAPEFSVKRMYADDSNTGGLAATTFVNARSILTFQHDKVVLPITVEWRARWHLGVQTSSITGTSSFSEWESRPFSAISEEVSLTTGSVGSGWSGTRRLMFASYHETGRTFSSAQWNSQSRCLIRGSESRSNSTPQRRAAFSMTVAGSC